MVPSRAILPAGSLYLLHPPPQITSIGAIPRSSPPKLEPPPFGHPNLWSTSTNPWRPSLPQLRAPIPTPHPTVPLPDAPTYEESLSTEDGHGTPGATSTTGTGTAGHTRADLHSPDMVAHGTFIPNFSPPVGQSSDPKSTGAAIQEDSGMGSRPPGGFLGYFQRSSDYTLPHEIRHQPPMLGHFYYGGSPAPYAPFEAPLQPVAQANLSQSPLEPGTTHSALGSQTSHVVDLNSKDDNGGSSSTFSKKENGDSRPGRRMTWTPEETMRLVSAWLRNSNDPIHGNWKRNDQYWGDVTAMFNSTTPNDRKRETKQLKEQWHRVNRTVSAFQSSWMKAERLRASGESDDLVTDKAMAFYEADFGEGMFKLTACWKVLRDQPKWHAYNEDLNGSNKRKYSEAREAADLTSCPDVVTDLPHPGGCKKAKEERNGKRKGRTSSSTMDEIDKLREGQAKCKEERIEVLEELARLVHLAAQEKKEAKLLEKEGKMHDKESKFLETYKSLLTFDTSMLTEDMKVEHMIAVKSMREKMFSNRASE